MRQHILVTGASSGLGAAIARHYASSDTQLTLWGRDRSRLELVEQDCIRAGATTTIRSLDLIDSGAAVTALLERDAQWSIDIAVLAAGLGDIATINERGEDPARMVDLGLVNFVTPAAMAAALADRMAERGRGHLVLIGSAAAFHALPFAAAYAATKAGLGHFAKALRIAMAAHGVHVLLVSPGPIDTPAGRRVPAPTALTMQPDIVAACIARASARGQRHLILPWPFRILRWVDAVLPGWLRDRLLRRMRPGRQALTPDPPHAG